MGTDAISPLRQRMIEDMSARQLHPLTQKGHIRVCKRFASFLKRSPETATADDIRRFQLHLAESDIEHLSSQLHDDGAEVPVPGDAAALGSGGGDLSHQRATEDPAGHQPGRDQAPVGSGEGAFKARVLFALGYGCGLRASEVVRLRVSDIDSAQGIIRVVQSKGRKDRNVMLSPEVLALLRQWWKARPRWYDIGVPPQERWLFPGLRRGKPMTTRQLNRLFHQTADAAGIRKPVTLHTLRHSFATHLLECGTDIRVIQALLGHAKLDATARYTRVATGLISAVESPLDLLSEPGKRLRRGKPKPAA